MSVLARTLIAALALTAAPAAAQDAPKPAWHSVLIDRDAMFEVRGERRSRTSSDTPSKDDVFVLPLKLPAVREDSPPVSARMVCYAGVHKAQLSPSELDLDLRYEQFAERRKERGFTTDKIVRADKGGVRILHAIGQRPDPHEHFVISLITAVRGDTVVSVTRNCTVQHVPRALGEVDFLALVERNTKVRFTFPTAFLDNRNGFSPFKKFVGMLG
ncbi:hypothetical protein [Qipengyuania sp. DGS5-3]|uniref:hypothetical protein n=1 Tax=Qipengyuania sp. DGS5-3 TaxID=3349632 RepID=UPI0036D2573E